MLVGLARLPTRIFERLAGRVANPECQHERQTRQLAKLVLFLQCGVRFELRILDDPVAEAVDHQGDRLDAQIHW